MAVSVFTFLDEAMTVLGAVGSYVHDKDESKLAETLARALLSAADDATGGMATQAVDGDRLALAVAELVDVFEPVFGLDN